MCVHCDIFSMSNQLYLVLDDVGRYIEQTFVYTRKKQSNDTRTWIYLGSKIFFKYLIIINNNR